MHVDLVYDVNCTRCRITEVLGVTIPERGAARISGHHFQVTEARRPVRHPERRSGTEGTLPGHPSDERGSTLCAFRSFSRLP